MGEQKIVAHSAYLRTADPLAGFVRLSPVIWMATVLLVTMIVAAGLYFVPTYASYGVALVGLGGLLLLLLWSRPEYGLLAVVFLGTSLIRADLLDLRLPIGGGLELRDLALIAMLGLLILRTLAHHNLSIPWWPVGAPLVTFLCFALFSTVIALVYRGVALNWVFSELRAIIFYCVFFLTAWTITSERQLIIVLVGLFILADLVAGAVILQQFLGANNPLLSAMSYSNWQLFELQQGGAGVSFGMVRIMPPGVVLVYLMLLLAFCLMVFVRIPRLRAVFALQSALLGVGLLLTYTRALWVATAVAFFTVLIGLFPTYRTYLLRQLLIGAAALTLGASVLGVLPRQSLSSSALATTFVDRFASMFRPDETLDSYSLQWRVFETEQGLRAVSEHPLVGVGLGNSYREITAFQGEAGGWRTGSVAAGQISRLTRFLHNSYLYIAVKMGLPALICFLWFCVAFLVSGAKQYRNLSDETAKGITLGVLAGFAGLMLWSFFHQHFMQIESTAVVGLMAGLVAAVRFGEPSELLTVTETSQEV